MERTAKLTFLFATVYFVQGIGSPSSGIAAQPVLYLLKEQIGLRPLIITSAVFKQEKGAETMQYEQRPRIGIPCAHVEPEQGKFLPSQCVSENFLKIVSRAGGVCLYIPLIDDDGALRVVYDQMEGLLLMGGPDVHPQEYGEEPLPGVTRIDPLRDLIELRVTRWAPDGVVEGIESKHHRWVGGVQFHPESITDWDSRMQDLFTAFVGAAAQSRLFSGKRA